MPAEAVEIAELHRRSDRIEEALIAGHLWVRYFDRSKAAATLFFGKAEMVTNFRNETV